MMMSCHSQRMEVTEWEKFSLAAPYISHLIPVSELIKP